MEEQEEVNTYEVVSELGQGAQGSVFVVREINT